MSDELPLFNQDIWQEFTNIGTVKKLIRGEGSDQRVAYFKALSRRPGPSGANEYLVYKLGSLLGFPAATIQLIKFGETDGFISLGIDNSNPWQAFPDKENSKQFLEDETIFAKIIIFDMWVRNRDRHATNLVFQPRPNNKYHLYMIDHEHCLYSIEQGPPPSVEDFNDIVKLKEMARQLSGVDELISQAEPITQLGDDAIIEIVDKFWAEAPAYLNETQAQIIKDLLLKRKLLLKDKLIEWYNGGEWRQ